jgi:hypothetical protein
MPIKNAERFWHFLWRPVRGPQGEVEVDNRGLYMEEIIINSLKSLLAGRVNELLGEAEFLIPPVEFTRKPNGGYYAITPELAISTCERSEKDRVVLLDAYKVTITFTVPEHSDRRSAGERNGYAYAGAVDRALREDPTLGGDNFHPI